MNYQASEEMIKALLEALDQSVYGIGLAQKCEITSEIKGYQSQIEIKPMPGQQILPKDWFNFGFFAKEYLVEELQPQRYFTSLGPSSRPINTDNPLLVEVWTYFKNQSNRIIIEPDIYCKTLENHLNLMNAKHPKCNKMLLVRILPTSDRFMDGSIHLFVRMENDYWTTYLEFNLYPIK